MRPNLYCRLSIAALCATATLHAEPDPSYQDPATLPKKALTMRQALSLALKNNIDLGIDSLEPVVAAEGITQAWGAFDPQFSVSALREKIETPQSVRDFVSTGGDTSTVDQNGLNPRIFQEDNYRYSASLGGKVPLGTEYELRLELNRYINTLNRTSPLALYSPEYGSFSGLILTQPLLKDGGTGTNMAEIRIARRNKNIAELTLRENLIKLVGEVTRSYNELMFAFEDIKVQKEGLKLAQALLDDSRQQLERGMRKENDVQLAQISVSERYEKLLLAYDYLQQKQIGLKRLVLANLADQQTFDYLPVDQVVPQIPDLDRAKLLAQALAHRPAYLKAIEEAEREKLRLQFAQNQALPRLDLKATMGYNNLENSFGDSFGGAFQSSTPMWSAGVVASVPLGNIKGRASVRAAEQRKIQTLLNIKRQEADAAALIDKALTKISIDQLRVKNTAYTRELAKKSMEQEDINLEKGNTTSLVLLKFQHDYTQARTRELAAAVDLNNSLVTLWESTGVLLEEQKINLGK